MKIEWSQINKKNEKIPSSSGIYAWYYVPQISSEDINIMYSLLKENKGNISVRRQIIASFLTNKLFGFYSEDKYRVKITGDLKPTYFGELEHEDQVSNTLIDKIENGTVSLSELKSLLGNISEKFLSPIYIGMANNLSSRINQHKEKIIKIREGIALEVSDDDIEIRDNSFASRICERSYITSFMFVVFMEVDSKEAARTHNPFENILNRINYPILGRK